MAVTKWSDEFAKIREVPARRMDSSYAGKLRVINDTYTLTGDLATATEISFGKLPAGAKIVDCIVTASDLDGSGGTIDVGITGALDALHSNIDVTSAVSARLGATVGLYSVGASEVDLIVSTDGDTDATTGTIDVTCIYIVD